MAETHELAHQAAVPIIVGLVEVAKRTLRLPTRFAPLLALGLGVVSGFLMHSRDPGRALLEGLIIGLESAGLYSGGKALAGK
jgi:hypothetical protein